MQPTSTFSQSTMVPKLTRLQTQYLCSCGSMTLPSSSTSTSASASADAWPAPRSSFFRAAPRLDFFGAALRFVIALLPPEFVRLMMPGAGLLVLLLGCLTDDIGSGAGVFRAVLARRGRSAANPAC